MKDLFFFNFSFYKLTILSFSYFLSEWRAFVTTCCRKAIQSRQPLRLINCFWSKWLHSPATYFLSFAAIRLKLGCCSMLSFNPSSVLSCPVPLWSHFIIYLFNLGEGCCRDIYASTSTSLLILLAMCIVVLASLFCIDDNWSVKIDCLL